MSSCHTVILSYCHPVILSSCHPAILSSCHPVILSYCHPVILSSCHNVILSYCHPVILSSRHTVILSSCHNGILSYCHPVILSSCQPVILSRCLTETTFPSIETSSRKLLLPQTFQSRCISLLVRLYSVAFSESKRNAKSHIKSRSHSSGEGFTFFPRSSSASDFKITDAFSSPTTTSINKPPCSTEHFYFQSPSLMTSAILVTLKRFTLRLLRHMNRWKILNLLLPIPYL